MAEAFRVDNRATTAGLPPKNRRNEAPAWRFSTDCHGKMRLLTAAALSLLASTVAAGAASAPFDGRWSVLVLTRSGPCDPGYRYEVNVSQGKVIYAGDAAIGMQGTVTPSGQVKVSVGQGASMQAAPAVCRPTPAAPHGAAAPPTSSAPAAGRRNGASLRPGGRRLKRRGRAQSPAKMKFNEDVQDEVQRRKSIIAAPASSPFAGLRSAARIRSWRCSRCRP
jgi:hypothetical protein